MKNTVKRNLFKSSTIRSLALLIVLFAHVILSEVYAQTPNLTIQKKNITVKEVLTLIEKGGQVIFFYTDKDVDLNRMLNINLVNQPISKILDEVFKNSLNDFKIDGRQVYILKRTKQVEAKSKPEKKNSIISGVVTDERNQTVIGANIIINGSTSGTITDINGRFSIEAPEDAQLKISYIGYETKIVDIKGKTALNISINPTTKALEELVVVGYGLQKKSDVTGAIAQVKGVQIENTASSDIGSALQGKVSGVYIMNSGGQAGSTADIQIRGVTSLNKTTPLWIIDGVPGEANTVNMNDVETIDIIKDGTAAAIYGVKAAAGVILVTTKRGIGEKKAKVSFNTYTGTSSAWRLPTMLNSDQYVTLKNEQWASTGVPSGLTMDHIGKYSTTDWMKEMFKQGKVQNYDLNISGSNETSNYYIGGTYFKDEPSFIDNSIEKYSFRMNSDYKIAKWIKIGESLNFLYSKLNPVADGDRYLDGLFRTPPMMSVYDANNQPGGYGFVDAASIGNYDGGNPMQNQLTNQETDYSQKINGNIYATINIVSGLTVTGTFSGAYTSSDSKTINYPYYLSSSKDKETTDISLTYSKGRSMLFNVYANYVKDFGLNNINFTAGYEASQYADSYLSGSGSDAKYGLLVLRQTDISTRQVTDGEDHGTSISQFGRFQYQYANKYFLKAIVRRDGSDKFGPENRYGIFPSASFAWKLSEENFIKNISAISFLKLRGGYGINGTDNIDQYQYVSSMTSTGTGYPYGTSSTVVENTGEIASSSLANPAIQWARTKQFDAGLELGLFKNALFFNIEPYLKITDKMLFKKSLSLSSGLSDGNNTTAYQIVNTGRISNLGLDLSVTYKGNVGDFKYSLGANVSTFNYTVDQLADNSPLLDDNSGVLSAGEKISKTTVGESSGYFYGYKCDGIFQTQEQVDEYNSNARAHEHDYYCSSGTAPGDLIYRDLNGDGHITDADKEKIGSPWPKATYGFQATANYKGFDLLVTSSGVYKRDIFNASRAKTYQFGGYDYSTTTQALSRWTSENHSTTNFRIDGTDPNGNLSKPSSWYIEDGSFFRIKNIELGFTVPQTLSRKVGLSRFRLYVSGQNLFTFTKYTGLDPEIGLGSSTSSGIDGGSYPQSKVYTVGLQVEL